MSVILLGDVERVTFENAETGFRVVRLSKVQGLKGKKQITIVGIMPSVGKGTRVRVTGELETDRARGERVRTVSVVPVLPETQEGFAKYLASGVVHGIGPGFAARIVKYFGMETLAVLDHASHRLLEIPGLGEARVEKIRSSWAAHRQLSNVLLALSAHGASPQLAEKIVARFGERAAEIVQTSPYRLAIEIRGVGFKTADSLARSQGLALDHPERAEAGVMHQLGEQADDGHSAMGTPQLVERTMAMLGVDEAPVKAAIDRLCASGKLISDDGSVMLERLHQAERTVAERVVLLRRSPKKELPALGASVSRFEKDGGISLAPAQRAAVAMAVEEKFSIITGGPGVGKTTIVRAILHVLSEAKLRTALAAPTGRAAKRLFESTGHVASTLHRLLEVNAHTGKFQRDAENPLEVDLLIVDEASMLDVRLAASLFSAIPNAARVVLVGDIDQLPSVGPGAVLSDLIASEVVPVATLDTIFRQAETSGIVRASHQILRGQEPQGSQTPDGDFFVISAKSPARAQELVLQAVTERIPERFGFHPARDIQVLTPMHRGDAGTAALNRRLQEVQNPVGLSVTVGDTTLRLSDKVLQTRNDYDRGVFNGDVGEISEVKPESGEVSVAFEDDRGVRHVKYERSQLVQLSLAYAMTIHKSQGSEYPVVVIPLLTAHFVMLSRNLIYTAVTRARKLCVVIADPRALSVALLETRKESRQTRLAEKLRRTAEPSRS